MWFPQNHVQVALIYLSVYQPLGYSNEIGGDDIVRDVQGRVCS